MLENATNLTNATSLIGGLLMAFPPTLRSVITFLFGFLAGSGAIAVVLNSLFTKKLQKAQQAYDDKLRQQSIWNAIGQVIAALNNFETTWRAAQGKKRLPSQKDMHLQKDILFVLSMGINIKDAVGSIPTTLIDVDLSEALNIANQLESLKKHFDSVQPSDPFGSAQRIIPKRDIDELAERARLFAVELGGKRSKK